MKPTDSQTHVQDTQAQDTVLAEALGRQLDREVEEIDVLTQAKLTAARRRALDAQTAGQRPLWQSPVWASGFAAVAALAVVALLVKPGERSPLETPATAVEIVTNGADPQSLVLEDLPILAAQESVEFYQSIDFLLWLNNESNHQG